MLLQARFTIFMPVQALDLAIVTASSGMFCKQPAPSQFVPWQCVVLTIASHVFVAYLTIGTLVWYMDKQARQKFVLQRQLVSFLYCMCGLFMNIECGLFSADESAESADMSANVGLLSLDSSVLFCSAVIFACMSNVGFVVLF